MTVCGADESDSLLGFYAFATRVAEMLGPGGPPNTATRICAAPCYMVPAVGV